MKDLLLFLFWGYILYTVYRFITRGKKERGYTQAGFRGFAIDKESIQNSDLGLFVALAAKVAKADGRVDKLEAHLVGMLFDDISSIFPDPHKAREIFKEIFKEEKNRTDNIHTIASMLGRSTRRDRQTQMHFVGFLIQLAFADGEVTESENAILQTIAQAMEFDQNTYRAIYGQFESMIKSVHPQSTIKEAYELLGVSESDDMESIKKAYRNLIRKYHPDIIKSQNRGEAYMEEATRKTQEINKAYQMIKNARKE